MKRRRWLSPRNRSRDPRCDEWAFNALKQIEERGRYWAMTYGDGKYLPYGLKYGLFAKEQIREAEENYERKREHEARGTLEIIKARGLKRIKGDQRRALTYGLKRGLYTQRDVRNAERGYERKNLLGDLKEVESYGTEYIKRFEPDRMHRLTRGVKRRLVTNEEIGVAEKVYRTKHAFEALERFAMFGKGATIMYSLEDLQFGVQNGLFTQELVNFADDVWRTSRGQSRPEIESERSKLEKRFREIVEEQRKMMETVSRVLYHGLDKVRAEAPGEVEFSIEHGPFWEQLLNGTDENFKQRSALSALRRVMQAGLEETRKSDGRHLDYGLEHSLFDRTAVERAEAVYQALKKRKP